MTTRITPLTLVALLFSISSYTQVLSHEWSYELQTATHDAGRSIIADDAGNSYMVGDFGNGVASSTSLPLPNGSSLVGNGQRDAMIIRTNADGTIGWAHNIGGTNDEMAFDVDWVNSTQLVVVGFFEGTIDLNPDIGTTMVSTGFGDADGMLLVLDTAGSYRGALPWEETVPATHVRWRLTMPATFLWRAPLPMS